MNLPSSNNLDRFLSENNENYRDTPLQLTLYTRDRRDAIILYGLSHSMTLFQINDKLFTEKLDTLC